MTTTRPPTGHDPPDVIITARDIYTVTLSTAGKVDALVAGMAVTAAQLSDHEQRLRRMEARFFGIVGTFGLSAFALILWILEGIPAQ